MNLGSPDSTKVQDVRKYLTQFLMDPRVIDYPLVKRTLLVKGLIVPFRASKSAEAYEIIWTKEGSPLISLTRDLKDELGKLTDRPIEIAMRYGNPSPRAGFDALYQKNPDLEEVIVVPLYPHYAMSSYETAVEYAKLHHQEGNYPFSIRFVPPFYNNKLYIEALAERMRPYLNREYDHLLFSYHGVPGRHVMKSDPTQSHCLKVENCCDTPSPAHATCYRHQCFTTTKMVTDLLGIPKSKFSNSFQSRLGKGWLEPFTDVRLEQMPGEGIKKLLIISPAFISDCLETLEELVLRGKEVFVGAGGQEYEMIPCLNTLPEWVAALKFLVEEETVVVK